MVSAFVVVVFQFALTLSSLSALYLHDGLVPIERKILKHLARRHRQLVEVVISNNSGIVIITIGC
jgi:hypothetical protein